MPRKIKPAKDWHGHEPNDFIPEGSRDLDIYDIYRHLGLGDGSHLDRFDDPVFQISRALEKYTHEAHPINIPPFENRLALIRDLSRKATALSDAFLDTGEETYFDIENSISRALGQEPSADTPEEGYVSREIALFREFSADDAAEMAKLMELAEMEFLNDEDAPKTGRPAKTAQVVLIRELASIYEDHVPGEAYKKFTWVAHEKEYDNSFLRFAWEIVSRFDPKGAGKKSAFGKQVRNAISDSDQTTKWRSIIELEDITVDSVAYGEETEPD